MKSTIYKLSSLFLVVLLYAVPPVSVQGQVTDDLERDLDREASDQGTRQPVTAFDNKDDQSESENDPYRLEPALFPIIAGNSDIGFKFGAIGFLAKFNPGYSPYHWRAKSQFAMSVGDEDGQTSLTTHDDVIKWIFPVYGMIGCASIQR